MSVSLRRLAGNLVRKSPRDILRHTVRRWSDRLDAAELDFPLLVRDIADSQAPRMAQAAPPPLSGRRRLGWIVVPPGAGSGGHTTLFRMMEAARADGFENTLLFYDRYGSDFARNVQTVRAAWPWLDCAIEPVGDTLSGFDGIVASSWATAHVAARRASAGQPVVYFIQDFEPYFYPRGSEYALAEDSYRLGHRNVALGAMVRDRLAAEVGVSAEHVPFGCDTDVYRLSDPPKRRAGVLFYAKRGNDRRGHRLAVMALSEFHRRHPHEPIHAYGDPPRGLPFPVVDHGSVPPAQLNEIYNTVAAGIALSFTNISLVAEEMLAAGVVPVVNDSPLPRADLPNPHVAWAVPTAAGIADALEAALAAQRDPGHGRAVSASVVPHTWAETGRKLSAIIAEEVGAARGGEVRAGQAPG